MCNVKIEINECCDNSYGQVTGIFLLKYYPKCISEKIRFHLIKKQFEKVGVNYTQQEFNERYANRWAHNFSRH